MTRGAGARGREARALSARTRARVPVFDRILGWIDGVPGPAWVFYVVVTAAAVAVSNLLLWMDRSAAGSPAATVYLFSTLLTAYPLALSHYLTRAARGSLESFRPALGKLQAEYPRLRANLTSLSGRALWLAVALGVLITALNVIGSPSSWGIGEKMHAAAVAFGVVQGTWVDICVMALLFLLVQQIRAIAYIHGQATNINLYERGSQRAFSRLTLVAAIGLLIPVYGFALLARVAAADSSSGLSGVDALMIGIFVLFSAAVFAVPLYGMRRRLEKLKKDAIQECDRRFEAAVKRLHARLDAGSAKDLQGLNHTMAALSLEREALLRMSTWPWAADTLRRYISSIALPVFVFLLGRYIGRFFGL